MITIKGCISKFYKAGLLFLSFFVFVSYTHAQEFEWVSAFQGADDVFSQDVVTDNQGSVYSVGYFYGTADFDPGAGSFDLTSTDNWDIYISKLDVDGNFVWAHMIGNDGRNRANDIAIDNDGNIYITGYFEGTVDFDPGAGTETRTSTNVIDVFVLKLDADGNFLWVRQYGSTVISEGLGVQVDNNGDVLVGGYFRGDCDFDMAGGGLTLSSSDPGNRDAFLTKHSSNGDFLWVRHMGGVEDGRTEAITFDEDNNIYGTGFFEGTWDFDITNNPGVELENSNGGRDIFVYKLDELGNFVWSASAGDAGDDRGQGITVNNSGNVFATGRFEQTVDFDPGAGTEELTSSSTTDAFIWALTNNDGAFSWVNQVDGSNNSIGFDIAADDYGGVYATGYYRGMTAFDATTSIDGLGGNTIFVAKYLSDGELDWVERMGGTGNDFGFGIYVNADLEVLTTGYFRGDCDFDPDDSNVVLTATQTDAYVHKMLSICQVPVVDNVAADEDFLCPVDSTSVELTLTGDLLDAEEWVWYTGDCGEEEIDRGNSITVTPTETTTYFVRGEGGCVDSDLSPCESITIIVDDEGPVLTVSPISVDTHPGTCYYVADSLETPPATDDCGVDTVYVSSPQLLFVGVNQVTWKGVDINGNTSETIQEVTVIDNENPEISAPSDVTVSADADCEASGVDLGSPITSDNCSVTDVFNDAPATFPLGTTVVTWTVEDASGNQSIDMQNVTVIDDIAPTIIDIPDDIVVSNDPGECSTLVTWPAPTVDDNCPGASISQTGGLASGDNFPVGVTVVQYTAVDAAGNETSDSFTVTINDNEDPEIVAPLDLTVSANADCEALGVYLGSPTSSDNCSVASVSNDAPATFPLGTTVVTWTAEDASGNQSFDTQNITVVDDTAPTIVDLPTDINVSNDADECSALVSWTEPTVEDNCPGSTISQTTGPANGEAFPVGVTVVQYTAVDAAGNETSGSFTVTVTDNEAPEIDAPAGVTLSANRDCIAFSSNLGNPDVTDNCTIESIKNDAPSFFDIGTTVITWTVTDAAGNSSTATQEVTVVDDKAPSFPSLSPVYFYVDNDCEVTDIELEAPVVTDNCSLDTVFNDALSSYSVGEYEITWTAIDQAGNESTATQLLIAMDTIAPTAVVSDTVVILSVDEPTIIKADDIDQGSFDNCDVSSLFLHQEVFTCDDIGENEVLFTVEDNSGNTTTTSVMITIQESGIDENHNGIDDACEDVEEVIEVSVPNGFTPDGDGINDQFIIPGIDNYSSVELFIYNRYGNLVYEDGAYENDWNGTNRKGMDLPDGTYFYILKLDGEDRNGYVYINRVY